MRKINAFTILIYLVYLIIGVSLIIYAGLSWESIIGSLRDSQDIESGAGLAAAFLLLSVGVAIGILGIYVITSLLCLVLKTIAIKNGSKGCTVCCICLDILFFFAHLIVLARSLGEEYTGPRSVIIFGVLTVLPIACLVLNFISLKKRKTL